MNALPFLLLCAGFASPTAATSDAQLVVQQGRPADPLQRFRVWLERLRKGRESLEAISSEDLRLLIGDVRLTWAVDPGSGEEIATALLDLLGMCSPASGFTSPGEPQSRAGEARELCLEALRAHVDPEFLRWLAREVLAIQSQPLDRRAAAIEVLDGRREELALLSLLTCARESEPRMRLAALRALVGWEDESVHTLFLDELARGLAGGGDASSWLAEAHFSQAVIPPASPILARLGALIVRALASSDWREVSRSVALCAPLDDGSVIPFLIEALARWKSREEAGAQALRVEIEILRELERRSGRKLGPSPADWSAWWRAVRRGEVKGSGPRTGGYRETTRASFFGIAPASDRVSFVIDRSGSMETKFGSDTGGWSGKRWDQAVEQLLGFLDAIGPRAKFSIVVFHDYAEEWRPTLELADAENKKGAGKWLAHHHPGGGTQLLAGVARAMRLQPDGLPDLAALEADTIIVLCDGETAEGPDWVLPFLLDANARARVVFHCVKIGPGGDGTLEKLASGSGGDFVRVDG